MIKRFETFYLKISRFYFLTHKIILQDISFWNWNKIHSLIHVSCFIFFLCLLFTFIHYEVTSEVKSVNSGQTEIQFCRECLEMKSIWRILVRNIKLKIHSAVFFIKSLSRKTTKKKDFCLR